MIGWITAAGSGSNRTVNWHNENRSKETYESHTGPMGRLFKRSRAAEARLGYLRHVLTENRNGPVAHVRLRQAPLGKALTPGHFSEV